MLDFAAVLVEGVDDVTMHPFDFSTSICGSLVLSQTGFGSVSILNVCNPQDIIPYAIVENFHIVLHD